MTHEVPSEGMDEEVVDCERSERGMPGSSLCILRKGLIIKLKKIVNKN